MAAISVFDSKSDTEFLSKLEQLEKVQNVICAMTNQMGLENKS